MRFQKELKIELSDYVDFNIANNRAGLIASPILFVLALPWICYYIIDSALSFGIMISICYAVTVIFAALMELFVLFSLKRVSKKQYYSSKTLQIPGTLTLDSSGIEQYNTMGRIKFAWPDIYKASESGKSIFVYCSKFQAAIIPKRLLASNEEYSIREIINANLDLKKNKLKKR
jgi:hypothetical protein